MLAVSTNKKATRPARLAPILESGGAVDSESLTVGEVMAMHDALERNAATLLGQMLFCFGRLDLSLGLCLALIGSVAEFEARSRKYGRAGFGFNKKLERLQKIISALPEDSNSRAAYLEWIERAHALRIVRNDLAHGRWGFEAGHAINVVGLPSGTQRQTAYTLEQLASIVEDLRTLTNDLNCLRVKSRL